MKLLFFVENHFLILCFADNVLTFPLLSNFTNTLYSVFSVMLKWFQRCFYFEGGSEREASIWIVFINIHDRWFSGLRLHEQRKAELKPITLWPHTTARLTYLKVACLSWSSQWFNFTVILLVKWQLRVQRESPANIQSRRGIYCIKIALNIAFKSW